MKTDTWYNIAPKGETEAEISIYGTIGAKGISSKQFTEDLKKLGDVNVIHVRIDSPGGSINDGHVIYNALERHPAKVITHIDGQAFSMGSVISQVGDVRKMAVNAMFMIHNPSTITMGDADSLRKDADRLDTLKALLANAYSRSHYSAEELTELMDATTYMTADEALKAGFIDEIESGFRAAACDYQEMADEMGFTIPADKQLAVRDIQIEALDNVASELAGKLDAKVEELMTVSAELIDARAEVEAAELAKAEISNELTSARDALLAEGILLGEAKAEIEAAKIVTDEAVAQKAAELVQINTHAPVSEDDADATAKTADALMEEYSKLTDHVARRDFRIKHKDQFSKLIKG